MRREFEFSLQRCRFVDLNAHEAMFPMLETPGHGHRAHVIR